MANNELRYIFLGSTRFSESMLNVLLKKKLIPKAIFGLPKEFNISYSDSKVRNFNYCDLSLTAKRFDIPYIAIDSVKGKRLIDWHKFISSLKLDLILVLGWYYMVPKVIRELARKGAWGIHASLLPNYAGGAPLVWAIINGEKETGVTLFRLADGVDDGEIIAQERISILDNDTIKEVYEKASLASRKILVNTLTDIESVTLTPQDKQKIRVYSQRSPDDGEINLNWPAKKIHDFIRAQSSPYPGAFIRTTDGKKLILELSRIE
ncbi:MAG: hypothetical protein COV52_00425 [Gammaproteobacteria bacterium CG11_big_fil_rev_8_21_14_0_20_46_22]|nr:MAG: hypothetical protein COW05_09090 [Gammaproteobacteria bacterium CG12_big_fil_rev_8_21_14_0_65_46_12]PIR12121.1 MAG: hypothetical protein COV52_00425 [Gammaproteobacteria bacterium CG11_big_fil_rev_8_21_14_0_20_46_22]